MSVSQPENNISSPASFNKSNKNSVLKLAMSSFKAFEEGCDAFDDKSTKATSISTNKSKCSYDADDQIHQPTQRKFQINLTNLSPNCKQQKKFGYRAKEVEKVKAKKQGGKISRSYFNPSQSIRNLIPVYRKL